MIPRTQSEMLDRLCPMTQLKSSCVGSKCAVWEWGGEAPAIFLRIVDLRKEFPGITDVELEAKYSDLHREFSEMVQRGDGCEPGDALRIIEQKGGWTIKLQVVHELRRVGYCGMANS